MKAWPLLFLIPTALFAQDDLWDDDDWADEEEGTLWTGFLEAGLGTRFSEDPLVANRSHAGRHYAGELSQSGSRVDTLSGLKSTPAMMVWRTSGSLISETCPSDLQLGENTDVSIGRQVQTWGTGDLLFLNDLFPKDFQSFFSGRDDEYLKAPGNAIRITHFSPV